MNEAGFDIIGDVHGCADKLERLLHTMGYSNSTGVWQHPKRQAVFVGDFIDRGPRQLDAVAISRSMVEHGSALAVAGNHEFNAVSLATKDSAGNWNRNHSDRNLSQSKVFLDAVGFGSADHDDMIAWFMDLPLWLDLGGIRVVHACWHEASMQLLSPWMSDTNSLTPELVIEANTRDSAAFDAIEVVLKGPEAELAGYSYTDKDGHERASGRVTWWDPAASTLRSGIRLDKSWQVLNEQGQPVDTLPDTPLPEWLAGITPTNPDRTPVCFGHYWFSTGPDNKGLTVIDNKAACVDFSAVKGGPLVAYRWSGETKLTDNNLVAAH